LTGARDAPDPVDWKLAQRVAGFVAGTDPLARSYHGVSLERDFDEVTAIAEELVAGFTGLRSLEGPARAMVVDRRGWVAANIGSFRRMLEPFTARVRDRLAKSPLASVGRSAAGAEMGLLLGFLAQRVLGQYDLLLGDTGDAVYYVGPNVLALEKRFAFRPRDFRLWIALHEVTHRAQFTGVPWMKQYFLELVERSMEVIDPDPKRLVRALQRAVEEVRAGRNPLDGGLVGLLASDEQREVLDQVQALMSLLEGHGNIVMDRLGREHVVGAERMGRVLQARRETRGIGRQVQKLLGFEMKMRQYEIGERFIDAVEAQAGLSALDVAWQGPEWLPTLEELANPDKWLERVGTEAKGDVARR
jgi:coenzyme F420 biosynthesis associated uncharacterized protein